MAFFGKVVRENAPLLVVIDEGKQLVLSRVCTGGTPPGKHVSVEVKAKASATNSKDIILCYVDTSTKQCSLNVKFSCSNSPVEFSIAGDPHVHVHLTGYWDEFPLSRPSAVTSSTPAPYTVMPSKRCTSSTGDDLSICVNNKKKLKKEPFKNVITPWQVHPIGGEGHIVQCPKLSTLPSGISYTDFVIGNGPLPKPGAIMRINYVGMLADGKVFDSCLNRAKPLVFRKGVKQVIQGLDLGVSSMKIGGSREINIPSYFGYGDSGLGDIPGGANLIFRVTLFN